MGGWVHRQWMAVVGSRPGCKVGMERRGLRVLMGVVESSWFQERNETHCWDAR